MTKVAEQFEVSGSYMARVCSVLGVPRPERGYWAKLAVGKAPSRKPLPQAQPGDPLSWSKGGELPPPPKPVRPPIHRRSARVKLQTAGIHGLIRGAKEQFEAGRPVEEGAYLKPYKKLLVDVTTSKACLDKALDFANALFKAFESVGHRVMLAPANGPVRRGEIDEHEVQKKRVGYHYNNLWSPYRPTVVYIGTVAIGLAIVEMSEEVVLRYVRGKYIRDADYKPPKASRYYVDHSWTTTRDLPSGRLRLVAYSPYGRVSWSAEWQETKAASLTTKLAAIVKAVESSAGDLVEKLEEAERQAEIRHQKWLADEERRHREEDRRKVGQSVKDSQAQLGQIIQDWTNVMNVERFLAGVEEGLAGLPDGRRDQALQKLKLAREFIGTQDPLDFFLSWKTPPEFYQPIYGDADAVAEDEIGEEA
jgi:hypothetical protein